MTQVQVGNISVTRIEESLAPGVKLSVLLPDCTPDHIKRHHNWLVPDYLDEASGGAIVSSHSWVIKTDKHTILVDTCGGDHKNRPGLPRYHMRETGFLKRLAAAGVEPESVNYVMCTHLHLDHVGWNTRLENGRWVPTFPNARYLFSRRENDFWRDRSPEELGINFGCYEDSVLPVVQSGQAVMTDGDYEIDNFLHIEPAPGHTPGHILIRANSRGQSALFCGDNLHQPLQIYHPEWNTCFCELPDQAPITRRRILEYCCENNSLLFPAHFAGKHFGRIVHDADSFAFSPGAEV